MYKEGRLRIILQSSFHNLSSMPTGDSPATTITTCTLEALGECLQSWMYFYSNAHREISVRQWLRTIALSGSAACATGPWWQNVTHRRPQQRLPR